MNTTKHQNIETKVSIIPTFQHLDTLDYNLNLLEESIGALSERLLWVCKNPITEVTRGDNDLVENKKEASQISRRLIDKIEKVNNLNHQISYILHNLEV